MHKVFATAAVVSGLWVGQAAFAHHSFAPYFDSSKPVSISGTVVKYEARNPHSYLHVAAVDENGRTREYVCESHGVTQLTRNGIRPDMFKAGRQVSITGSQSRQSPYMCFFDSVAFEDGRKLSVNGQAGPASASTGRATAARKDIFGVWLLAPMPNRNVSGPQPMIQFLTPAGQKAVAAYDPFRDDPAFRCDPVTVRRVWGAPGTPLEIVRDGNDVVIRYEWMDARRVVHMGATTHPANAPRTSLGHSIGRFDGDALVIDTASFAPGVLNQYVEQPGQPTRGLLHSAALTTIERVHFDADRQRLVVDIDHADPDFFSRPFPRATFEYAPSDLKIEPFNCSREGVDGAIKR